FYRTPAELKTQVSTEQAQLERVGGEVINSAVSVQGSLQSTVIKFELQHGGETVPVVYEGVIPNTFRDGAQVIAEGTYSSGQVFEASRVLVKCPDTYLPEKALARFLQGTQLENWLYR
ncbi:MAG: cytochrome c maturation protein CcmE, partial [Terriglobia bacterium]